MEELLKIAYREFLDQCDVENSKEIRLINSTWKGINEAIDILQKELKEKVFDDVYDKITDSVADIQEANFIAGFAYCTKLLTNGKIDLMPNNMSI